MQAKFDTMEISVEWPCEMKSNEDRWCCPCNMWLNCRIQYEDHRIGKKHRNNAKRIVNPSADFENRDKGVVVPRGKAIIIEQSAIFKDFADNYMFSLYAKAAFRARL